MRPTILALLITTLLLGCRPEQPDMGTERKAAAEERARAAREAAEGGAAAVSSLATTALSPEEAKQILAEVGDVKISAGDVARAISRLPRPMQARYVGVDARRELLQRLVEMELLSQEARAQGFEKDVMVQHALKKALAEELLRTKAAQGTTLRDVTEAEILAHYEAHPEQFTRPERRRCAVLSMDTREEIEAVRKELLGAIGENPLLAKQVFGDFVSQKSIDRETRVLRGDLGLFNREGRDNKGAVKAGPAVIKQVFGLQKLHELSGPFELENGSWAIAQLTRIEASETSALKDVRLTIQDNLLRDKRIEERTAYIDGLLSRTKVIIHDEVLKEMKIDVAEEKGWDPSSPKPPPVKTIQLPPNAFSGKGSLLRPGGLEKQVPLKADPIVRMKAEEIQEQMRRDP